MPSSVWLKTGRDKTYSMKKYFFRAWSAILLWMLSLLRLVFAVAFMVFFFALNTLLLCLIPFRQRPLRCDKYRSLPWFKSQDFVSIVNDREPLGEFIAPWEF